MRMGVLTRWELSPEEKFQAFYAELFYYLRHHLLQVPRCPDVPGKDLMRVCPAIFEKTRRGCGDPNSEYAIYMKRFCEERRLDWDEVREMLQEFTGAVITCDCHILETAERGF